MANFVNDDVLREWAQGIVTNGKARRMRGGTVWTDETGVIHYGRTSGYKRQQWGPVVLANYLSKHRTVLLNGDGFTDNSATNWQTGLRSRVQALSRSTIQSHVQHVAVIPYQALTAAGIVLDSIKPIHVVNDEMEEVWHRVEVNEKEMRKQEPKLDAAKRVRTYEMRIGGATVQLTERRTHGYKNMATGEERPNIYRSPQPRNEWTYVLLEQFHPDPTPWTIRVNNATHVLGTWDKGTLAQAVIQRQQHNRRVANVGRGDMVAGEIPSEPGFYWTEQIHHLGACLFSAVDESGRRHKFLSAFDEEEQNSMYFLAQLPDGSGATNYREAVLALAPPLVHTARLEGRTVRRQGDVFAIKTSLTDEEVYEKAHTRVRRAVALYPNNASNMLQVMQGRTTEPEVLPGEVFEKVECLCRCGHKRVSGWGPKARRALCIYGTGHTATEVVTTRKGVTYIRGTMHHDPFLTEPGRQREHADVELGDGWFVAVRNTVPRKQAKPRVEAREEAPDGSGVRV